MKVTKVLYSALLIILLTGVTVSGVNVKFWEKKSFKDFHKGRAEGLSVSSSGTVSLSKTVEKIAEPKVSTISGLAFDKESGDIYFGDGENCAVYRFNPSNGSTEKFFEEDEVLVEDIAFKDGNLYVGTGVDGKIFRVTPEGNSELYFDADEKYIWTLEFGRKDTLYAGTGLDGKIYQITGKNESEMIFDSGDFYISDIVIDGDGTIYAGSYQKGLIYRIKNKNDVFVMYDSELQQISSLAIKNGDLYAAATNIEKKKKKKDKNGNSGKKNVIVVTPSGTNSKSGNGKGKRELKSRIYRINPDGYTETITEITGNLIYTLIPLDKEILAGTGENGGVFLIDRQGNKTLLDSVISSQITAACISDGGVYLAGSNLGSLYHLKNTYRINGTYTSEVFDADNISDWGVIKWVANVPEPTKMEFQTRSGNTEDPDNTWSGWSKVYSRSESEITSPASRFIQWKVTFTSRSESKTPVLKYISLSHMQKNIPPEIKKIAFDDHGYFYEVNKRRSSSTKKEILSGKKTLLKKDSQKSGPSFSKSDRIYKKGMRTLFWNAEDKNGDALRYSLYYKNENKDGWNRLAENLEDYYYFWNTLALPDGGYRVKVTAGDSPSNPESIAEETEKITDIIFVDNTPPRIEIGTEGNRLQILATDGLSHIEELQYSLEGGEYKVLYPKDGMADSSHEVYTLDANPGVTVNIYVIDSSNNSKSYHINNQE